MKTVLLVDQIGVSRHESRLHAQKLKIEGGAAYAELSTVFHYGTHHSKRACCAPTSAAETGQAIEAVLHISSSLRSA